MLPIGHLGLPHTAREVTGQAGTGFFAPHVLLSVLVKPKV